jgi:hypothetical protein
VKTVHFTADLLIERFHFPLDGGHQQVIPAGKVTVEGGAGDAGFTRHLLHASGGDAGGQVTALGGGEDPVPWIISVIDQWPVPPLSTRLTDETFSGI